MSWVDKLVPFEHNPFFSFCLQSIRTLKESFALKAERLLAREQKFSGHRESEKDCVDIVVVIVLISQ